MVDDRSDPLAWYMYEQNYLELSGRTQRDPTKKYYAV